MSHAEELFDAAVKEAKRRAALLPILENIKKHPEEAANIIFEQMRMIDILKLKIKQLEGED